ncbi:hypothetical protein FB45DRAFT_1126804 [Roridomyces roridus]|uniref:F-box domain-containing protein n=1 Tax=Roridomyces roridus TaxID=1738132 RepID=A0AAD7B424_9AGAR|nr:hypothetical protein FB45DRAFT_1126804 [Roridomyces roridus]
MRNLSQELTDLVLDQVAELDDGDQGVPSSIANCGLVCRSWAQRSRLHLFEAIAFPGSDLETFVDLVETSAFPLLSMVKSFELDFNEEQRYRREHLTKLQECVNLTSMTVTIPYAESEDLDDECVSYTSFFDKHLPIMGAQCGSLTSFVLTSFFETRIPLDLLTGILASLPALEVFKITDEIYILSEDDDDEEEEPSQSFPENLHTLDLSGVHSRVHRFFRWLMSLPTVPVIKSLEVSPLDSAGWASLNAYAKRAGQAFERLHLRSAADEPPQILRHATVLRDLRVECIVAAHLPAIFSMITSQDLQSLEVYVYRISDTDPIPYDLIDGTLATPKFRNLRVVRLHGAQSIPTDVNERMPLTHARGILRCTSKW